MFARESDASKVALVALAQECQARGIRLIDCQVTSEHMLRMGAREIRRHEFLERLRELVSLPIGPGRWEARAGRPIGGGR